MKRRILFLCTGNYYRSRFAEILFNHQASRAGIDWIAESRGLKTEIGIFNIGPISVDTLKRAADCGIECHVPPRSPIQCCEGDLAGADRVIALKENEHRKMMEERFPNWPDRIEYWHVHDLDMASADQALGEIEALVGKLVRELSAEIK